MFINQRQEPATSSLRWYQTPPFLLAGYLLQQMEVDLHTSEQQSVVEVVLQQVGNSPTQSTEELRQQLSEKNAMVQMLKNKTKDFVDKLLSGDSFISSLAHSSYIHRHCCQSYSHIQVLTTENERNRC